eukprot:6194662-Pleurochrysis_carterae.AAC.1
MQIPSQSAFTALDYKPAATTNRSAHLLPSRCREQSRPISMYDSRMAARISHLEVKMMVESDSLNSRSR